MCDTLIFPAHVWPAAFIWCHSPSPPPSLIRETMQLKLTETDFFFEKRKEVLLTLAAFCFDRDDFSALRPSSRSTNRFFYVSTLVSVWLRLKQLKNYNIYSQEMGADKHGHQKRISPSLTSHVCSLLNPFAYLKKIATWSSLLLRKKSKLINIYSWVYMWKPCNLDIIICLFLASSYSRSPSYSCDVRRRGSDGSLSSRGSYSRHSADRWLSPNVHANGGYIDIAADYILSLVLPRLRDRKRTPSSREKDVKHSDKAGGKRRRRKSYSPMKKRRRDSPSHLEARRITR